MLITLILTIIISVLAVWMIDGSQYVDQKPSSRAISAIGDQLWWMAHSMKPDLDSWFLTDRRTEIFEHALNFYQQAIDNDVWPDRDYRRALAYFNAGVTEKELGNYNKALWYWLTAYNINNKMEKQIKYNMRLILKGMKLNGYKNFKPEKPN